MKKILSLLFVTALIISAFVLVSCTGEPKETIIITEEVVVPHEHTFKDEEVFGDCDAKYINHTCDCGYSYQDGFEEAHEFVSKVVIPTCHDTGYTLHECTLCGYSKRDTFTNIDPENHVFYKEDGTLNAIEVVESTCTDFGYTLGECIHCGTQKYLEIDGNLKEHDWTDWTVEIEANCINQGLQKRTCKKCNAVESEVIVNSDAHEFGEWTIITDDNHINDFYQERSCKLCRYTEEHPDNVEDVLEFKLVVEADGSRHYVVLGLAEGKNSATVIIPEYLYDENGEKIYVTEINAQAFMNSTEIKTLRMPTSITKIGRYAFSGWLETAKIEFSGTKAQWEAIEKVLGWNYKSGDFKVVTK